MTENEKAIIQLARKIKEYAKRPGISSFREEEICDHADMIQKSVMKQIVEREVSEIPKDEEVEEPKKPKSYDPYWTLICIFLLIISLLLIFKLIVP